ncbi:hypothetical protein IFR04_005357 [Cadophora malorum]|uniref:Uncharacterized protein n=1 Tax=Cadophora malorum TaxID=108018 RepID=A0A8H7TMD0_9HELO|nr:hypothetical protein IFR04_005357 [Cadophora malorum]
MRLWLSRIQVVTEGSSNIYSAASAAGQKYGVIAYNLERCHPEARKLHPNASSCIQRRTAEYNAWNVLINQGCHFPGGNPIEDELRSASKILAQQDVTIAKKNTEIIELKKEVEVTTERLVNAALSADVAKIEDQDIRALKKRLINETNQNVKYSILTENINTKLENIKAELEEKNSSFNNLLVHTDRVIDARNKEIEELKEQLHAANNGAGGLDTLKKEILGLKNTLKQREGELKAIKTTVFSANKDKFASIKKTNGLKRKVKELGGDVSDYVAEGEDVGNVQARASAGYPSSEGAKSGIDAGEAHDGSDAKPSVSEQTIGADSKCVKV